MSLARRFAVFVVLRVLPAALACGLIAVSTAPSEWTLHAQGQQTQGQQTLLPGRNVNMVSGTKWPDGDPYLQRQNEPSIAGSTRNPLHLLAGANDYRTVDVPFVNDAEETGDAWLGIFKSFDGGQRWQTTLLPGYPQDTSAAGMASPIHGYQAGADPVVRAGTNGLFYYAGLVFDREENGRSAVFVARYIDNNNQEDNYKASREHVVGDPIRYVGTRIVARDNGRRFLDKPWIAVDIPRDGRTCRIPGPDGTVQVIPAGTVYAAFSAIYEDRQGLRSDILLSRSTDCGASWSAPATVNDNGTRINQGATIAIDPRNGTVHVAWRTFSSDATPNQPDGIMTARSTDGGRKFSAPGMSRAFSRGRGKKVGLDPEMYFEHRRKKRATKPAGKPGVSKPVDVAGEVDEFDQTTSGIDGALMFRTNAYPSMAIDGAGRVYLAWAERGFTSSPQNDARIVIATSSNGRDWTAPRLVSHEGQDGHQLMPSLTFGGGRLVVVYYDLREDITGQFTQFIDDRSAIASSSRRHTLDLRASVGLPGATPVFADSVRVSDYLMAFRKTPTGALVEERLQFNPPNLPMFKQGTAPFMGDYVDVTVSPAFVPTAAGGWAFNTNGAQPVFHAVWTDNRDVRQPGPGLDGKPDWSKYTPPTQRTGSSVFDPSEVLTNCDPNSTGSRNQNIYTARLSTGLVVGSPGNTKPLSTTLQRAFVVFAQNTSSVTKSFRMTIPSQPPGGRASFRQFDVSSTGQPLGPLTSLIVTTPARSTAARSVYATSSNPSAQILVDVVEVPYGTTTPAVPLADRIILNPDIANPDIANPDIANPDIANPDIANPDIANTEVYNPDIANPDIANPDIANPDIANPDIANPDIANPDIANPDIANPDIANPDIANPDIANARVANPDIANPDIANPDIANPDIANPDIANPDIANPDIANGSLTDVTWTMTNNGNTTAAFNVNLFLSQQTDKICPPGTDPSTGCIATQLVLRKVYNTPVATGCELQVQSQNVLLASIPNPQFVLPGEPLPDQNSPEETNATLWLAPGETAKITLRVYDPDRTGSVEVDDTDPSTPTPTPGKAFIDPVFLPTTTTNLGSVTPVVQQQSVDTEDIVRAIQTGAPAPPTPPVVTPLSPPVPAGSTGDPSPTPVSLAFTATVTGAQVGEPFAASVVVRDQYGALLPNADVRLFVGTNPGGAMLSGGTAQSLAGGIATFPALSLSAAGVGYTLLATAGQALPAVSNGFSVGTLSATVSLSNLTQTADGWPKSVIVSTVPPELAAGAAVTYDGSANAPSAVGSYAVVATVTDPNYVGSASGTLVINPAAPDLCAPFQVTTTADAGPCSLRQAMLDANATPGPETITFAIPGFGPHTIDLATRLPSVVGNPMSIDATTQSGFVGGAAPTPAVFLNGGGLAGQSGQNIGEAAGVEVYSTTATIKGLGISGFPGPGVFLFNASDGSVVEDNSIGTLAPNGAGVRSNYSSNVTIRRNVISGNTGDGVLLIGGDDVQVLNNRIGTAPDGLSAMPNTNNGITAYDGTTLARIENNLIAGNAAYGVDLQRSGVSPAVANTQILSNTIGLNTAGAALANGGGGVRLTGTEGTVLGAPGAGNTISGNDGPGVVVNLPDSAPIIVSRPVIRANYIGTDQTGTLARPNRFEGIVLHAAATVGGTAEGDGNLISGNGVAPSSGTGVLVLPGSNGSAIQGNIIGLGVTGAPLGNGYSGITVYDAAANVTIGGTVAGARNIISGNPSSGIAIYPGGTTAPSSITIQGNYIGTDVAGTSAAGNGGWGVAIDGTSIVVGGLGAGEGNLIAHNAAGGVQVASATAGVSILSNSIVSNGGLGVDVNPAGVSGLAPVLSNATVSQVEFLAGAAGHYTYQFFANATCDGSGYGEGQMFLGSFDSSTSGTALFATAAPPDWFVTATATDAGGNTTEFSGCTVVSATGTEVSVVLGNFSAVYDGSAKAVTVATAPVGGLSVDVTYAGSPTEPTAIGAYAVVATVTSPGYSGSATATFKIASTLAAGGGGGGPYERYCGPGVFAKGVGVSPPTESLWNAKLLCSEGNNPPNFGNTDYPPYNTAENLMACGPGEVMVGLSGRHGAISWASNVVIAIAPVCQSLAGGSNSTPFPAAPGSATGTPFSLYCPTGQAVTGVVGGQGSVVDSIALVCGTRFTETVITGDSSILTDGLLVAANNLGPTPSAVTVNGVTFGTDQSGLGGSWSASAGDFSTDAFTPELDAVLSGNQYTPWPNFSPVSLTIGGLTPGENYRLQLLFSNDLNGTGNNVNVTVQGTTWTLDGWQPNAINLAAGFTATSSSVVVTFGPGPGTLEPEASRALLSGYVIHRMAP